LCDFHGWQGRPAEFAWYPLSKDKLVICPTSTTLVCPTNVWDISDTGIWNARHPQWQYYEGAEWWDLATPENLSREKPDGVVVPVLLRPPPKPKPPPASPDRFPAAMIALVGCILGIGVISAVLLCRR
jgi:hypothetical protein